MSSENPDTLATSRRGFLALAAGAVIGAAAGAKIALAQTGPTNIRPATEAVEPFTISVPPSAIEGLKRRLEATRWPERETVHDWSQGVPLDKAKALIAYWRDHYDWRRFEARANTFPQFRTKIDELGIHFIHMRSPHANALPIILTHGWPGSFVDSWRSSGR